MSMNRVFLLFLITPLGGCGDWGVARDPDEPREPPSPPPVHARGAVDAPPAAEPEAMHAEPEPLLEPEPRANAGASGMSWHLNRRFDAFEVVDVGCAALCDPYTGDTPCTEALPYLCFEPRDAPPPEGLAPGNQYHAWSGGAVRLTPRSWAPATDGLTSFADADALCAKAFGRGWRVARFHDGWGWNFRAFGYLESIDPQAQRFWAHIDDQAQGNCYPR